MTKIKRENSKPLIDKESCRARQICLNRCSRQLLQLQTNPSLEAFRHKDGSRLDWASDWKFSNPGASLNSHFGTLQGSTASMCSKHVNNRFASLSNNSSRQSKKLTSQECLTNAKMVGMIWHRYHRKLPNRLDHRSTNVTAQWKIVNFANFHLNSKVQQRANELLFLPCSFKKFARKQRRSQLASSHWKTHFWRREKRANNTRRAATTADGRNCKKKETEKSERKTKKKRTAAASWRHNN